MTRTKKTSAKKVAGSKREGSAKPHISEKELSRAFTAASGDKVDLFVYGTLLHNHYVNLLLNRSVKSIPAVLYNYMRIAPSWSFPFVVKQHGAKTEGLILQDITSEELAILDSFEDEGVQYIRRPVVVRVGEHRQRCQCYIGNIPKLQQSIGREVKFEDRYSIFIEKKIDDILASMLTEGRPNITRRVLRELMSSAVDRIIESHFEGNYICNYIMKQALEEAYPPKLVEVLKNEELKPYAGNYMRLACRHIVFNQIEDAVYHQYPDAVRVSQQYFRHGIGILLAFLYYNRHNAEIDRLFRENKLDGIVEGRTYRDYATIAIDIFDSIYNPQEMEEIIAFVEKNWCSSPTPLGAELEFSDLGYRAVYATPGEDKRFDGFYWFHDFDMFRRTWKLGGHVDSHRQLNIGQKSHRGFLEYAFGRFQIVGDLSRPIFDCPWAMSLLINEAVKFLDIAPHSLHISFELDNKSITQAPHKEEDLVCLLLLGGDIRPDEDGVLRENRIHRGDLDTNYQNSINFSDRKYHFFKPQQEDIEEAANVMEYKFMRLHKENTDYESLIVALKGYQFAVQGRPISIQPRGKPELPEQIFLRRWATSPSHIDSSDITAFLDKVQHGLEIEEHSCKPNKRRSKILERISERLYQKNREVSEYAQR